MGLEIWGLHKIQILETLMLVILVLPILLVNCNLSRSPNFSSLMLRKQLIYFNFILSIVILIHKIIYVILVVLSLPSTLDLVIFLQFLLYLLHKLIVYSLIFILQHYRVQGDGKMSMVYCLWKMPLDRHFSKIYQF